VRQGKAVFVSCTILILAESKVYVPMMKGSRIKAPDGNKIETKETGGVRARTFGRISVSFSHSANPNTHHNTEPVILYQTALSGSDLRSKVHS
jgi:hypothetical protein